jgi:hypothetical protein
MSQRTSDHSEVSVTLLERNGRFFFFQPLIGVIASDASIETAYEKFLDAQRAFWSEVEQAGLIVDEGRLGTTPGATAMRGTPQTVEVSRSVKSELGLFVAKLCIALVLIGVIGGAVVTRAASGVAAAIEHAIGPSKSISMADVSRKAADIVKDLQSLTKEEKESLRQSVGAISREVDPVVDAWRNPPARP